MIKRIKEFIKQHEKLRKILKRFLFELTPFGFIAGYIIFPLQRFCRLHIYCPARYKKIQKLKHVHRGQRCFILATGPSLRLEDVKLLEHEYTIGVNTIYKMFEKLSWKPTYYVMTDPMLFQRTLAADKREPGLFSKEYSIICSLNRKSVADDEKVIFVHNCWLDHVYHYGESKEFRFDDHPEGGVYDYYSVTQECIYYAMYMGFEEIYLLGADNNYLGAVQHFEETEGEERISYEQAVKSQHGNDWAYEYLNEAAKQKNIRIYNATRGGRVEAFERVKLEEVLERRK